MGKKILFRTLESAILIAITLFLSSWVEMIAGILSHSVQSPQYLRHLWTTVLFNIMPNILAVWSVFVSILYYNKVQKRSSLSATENARAIVNGGVVFYVWAGAALTVCFVRACFDAYFWGRTCYPAYFGYDFKCLEVPAYRLALTPVEWLAMVISLYRLVTVNPSHVWRAWRRFFSFRRSDADVEKLAQSLKVPEEEKFTDREAVRIRVYFGLLLLICMIFDIVSIWWYVDYVKKSHAAYLDYLKWKDLQNSTITSNATAI